MQIDFHHTVTYVVARFAGFTDTPAATIAHAAQYVDDSTETGFVTFDNGMRYYRQATAHPVSDPENIDENTDAESWLPFHFLPGGQASSASAPYMEKLVCRPDSAVARAMVDCALADKGKPWELHRLGIAAHVYADTWAHQGFVGLNHDINAAGSFQDEAGNSMSVVPLPLPPVGHGQARTFPDMPYLAWSYQDSTRDRVVRDNPADFLAAANALCVMFQHWLGRAPVGLAPDQQTALAKMFSQVTDEDGADRHEAWLQALSAGDFSFGPVDLDYDPDQWKKDALGGGYERKLMALAGIPFPWSPAFLTSDWKLFHDAARRQRHDVFNLVLPQFGILEN